MKTNIGGQAVIEGVMMRGAIIGLCGENSKVSIKECSNSGTISPAEKAYDNDKLVGYVTNADKIEGVTKKEAQ